MDMQLKRGLFEICVLAAIRDEDSYGYRIIKTIPFCGDMASCIFLHIKIEASAFKPKNGLLTLQKIRGLHS